MWVLQIQTQVFFLEQKMFYMLGNFPLIYFFNTGVSNPGWPYACEKYLDFLIHMPLLGAESIS